MYCLPIPKICKIAISTTQLGNIDVDKMILTSASVIWLDAPALDTDTVALSVALLLASDIQVAVEIANYGTQRDKFIRQCVQNLTTQAELILDYYYYPRK